MDYKNLPPLKARLLFRENAAPLPTSGVSAGFVQCNLIILPAELAADFKGFADKNKAACPVLEMTEPGERRLKILAADVDIARDVPKYRVYINGELKDEPADVSGYWRDDLVSFMIGCSFSFEEALINAGIPMRHNEMGRNVPMYFTNIDCEPYGAFTGKMVVSMRPVKNELIEKAYEVTGKMPKVHGRPIHHGDGGQIGIKDVRKPDFGDAVEIYQGETPVFWPCGVTSQSAVMSLKPPFAITHAPGYMFISDVLNAELMEN